MSGRRPVTSARPAFRLGNSTSQRYERGYQMSFSEAPWGRFVARSALLLGVVGLALMAIFIAVLPVDLSDPNAELVAAARNPVMYRLAALLDILVWFGIGGVLLAFAGYFATRAPIRALVLAAAGAGQVIGALGGYMRLG